MIDSKEERRDHKVYKYTNKINGKVYIGRTCQSLRRRAHFNGTGYKKCAYFWRAIQKYGWENFEGEILEEGLTDVEASEREAFYMKEFSSLDRNKGYNTLEGGYRYYSDEFREKMNNKVVSKETRKKISENHANFSGENNPMWGRRRTDEEKKRMREAFLGRTHSRETCEKLSQKKKGRIPWNKGKKFTQEQKKNMKKPNKANQKSVICVETRAKYESLEDASRVTGINPQSISYACRGLTKTAGGYHWKWEKDPSKHVYGRKIRCVETNVIYDSIKEASEKTEIGRSSISGALRRGGASRGVHWEYIDE